MGVFVEVFVQEGYDVPGVELRFVGRVGKAVGFIGVGDQGDIFARSAESLVEPLGMLRGNKGVLAPVVQQERLLEIIRVVHGRNAAQMSSAFCCADVSDGEGIFSCKGSIHAIHFLQVKHEVLGAE